MKSTRVSCVASVGALVLAMPAFAQSHRNDGGRSDWPQATQALRAGDDVRVTLDDETSVRGKFVGADDQGVTLAVGGSGQQLSRARIARLSVTYETTRRRHESIGRAIGIVVGAWIWNRRCGKPRDNCQEETGLYFGGPMLAGGGMAHVFPARPAWRDLYTNRAVTRTGASDY